MPSASALATFLGALLVLELTPGPDMMLVLARGIGQGRTVALMTVVGSVFVAGLVQISLLVLGVVSLLQAYPSGLLALRWAGGAYLVYLGAKLIVSSLRGDSRMIATVPVSRWSAVRQGAINNLTNPKSLLFMFAFLPQFADPRAGPIWSQLLVLGIIQKLAGIASLGFVAVASGAVGEWMHRWPSLLVWQRRLTGSVMVGLGLRLLLSGEAAAPPVVKS
jgi:threonine/homoserine/homoserine lactone efflux protein